MQGCEQASGIEATLGAVRATGTKPWTPVRVAAAQHAMVSLIVEGLLLRGQRERGEVVDDLRV